MRADVQNRTGDPRTTNAVHYRLCYIRIRLYGHAVKAFRVGLSDVLCNASNRITHSLEKSTTFFYYFQKKF